MTHEDLHVKVNALPAAYWFVICFLGFMSSMCLLSFFQRMSYAGADEYFMLIVGMLLAFATLRSLRYFLWPVVSVTDRALTLFRFWKPSTRWNYVGTVRFEVTIRRIEVRNWTQGGRKVGRSLHVEEIAAVAVDGSRKTTLLPGFAGQNEILLNKLAERSRLPVDRIDVNGAPFVARLFDP